VAIDDLLGSRLIWLGLLWVVSAGVACVPDAAARATAPAVRATRVHRCTDARGSSRVSRAREADGGETLRGDTDIPLRRGSSGRLHLSEQVTLDGRGQLVAARIVVAQPRAALTTYLLEPRAGTVRVQHEGAASVTWQVPADAPWIYRAGSSGEGLLASTPVAAWLAARAAGAGQAVRVLVPERGESYLAPLDQVAVATETGSTVVLDSDGVDSDGDFITQARLSERGLTMECAEEQANAAR
jgi:hypothetical protein